MLGANELFGNPLVDFNGLGELILRFAVDFFFVYLLVRKIFYKHYKQDNYAASYFLINISVFTVCIFLNNIQPSLGFAFGLFAVFSIVRYRTEHIPMKEMTYLFVTILLAVMNALSVSKISYAELILANLIVITCAYMIENVSIHRRFNATMIQYGTLELIHPDKKAELIEDLKAKTGLDVDDVEVGNIDLIKGTTKLRVFYRGKGY